jgi:hypothetical protein
MSQRPFILPIHLLSMVIALMALTGCERDTYSTWNCSSSSETKITMVLKKAQMAFRDLKLDYCGSLGNQSFFDQQCPAQIQKSSHVFTPSTGLMIGNSQEYQCKEL